ncbi:MAG: SusC/RagA family TonB-linked outer membrane protein [Bacteroidales bacterium]|nr:SusC/RagA family TonB-linked outer membrane protein [Bacteroidales bacterium]
MKPDYLSHPFRWVSVKLAILMALLTSPLHGYAQQLTAEFRNVTVEQALEQLKNKEGYSFLFKTDDLDLSRKISGKFRSEDISRVLEKIFDGQDVEFEITGKMVVISHQKLHSGKGLLQTARPVTGTVKDSGGIPLAGVGIFVKGSSKGTFTDMDGKFSIEVSTGDELEFSYLGFDTQAFLIGKSDNLNVIMHENANDLDEAVVVGYGTVRKSDLTGAVASVKSADLPMASNASIAHMLSGRAAGVSITQNSAQPGGGVEMLIRGGASTGAGNEPLYVIDGFPVGGSSVEPSADNRYSDFGSRNPLNSINPNDIQSIEILKDASSTAIYGARAANGVVLITTKKGREGRPVVSYNGSYGVQQIANRIEMMNATEFMLEANRFAEEKWYYDNRVYPYGNTDPSTVSSKMILPYSEKQIEEAGEGTDWYSLVTQMGSVNQHNLSVSGGTSSLKYMASFNFYDQNGVVKNSDFTRYTGRINIEHQIGKIFTYGINATQSYIRSSNIPLGTEDFENSGLLNSALAYDPTVPVRGKDGSYSISPLMATVPNPVSMLEIDDYTVTKRLLVNSFVQAEIVNGLFARVNLGFDDQNGVRNSYLPKSTLYGKQEGGKASKSMASQFDKLLEATLRYDFNVGNSHRLNLLAGYSWQDFTHDGMAAANSQFFTDQFKYNSLQSGEGQRPTVSSSKSRNVLVSYFARVNYNLLDRYLFTFTFRADGSNKFGSNNRYGYFPSGAFAWKINNESFLKDFRALSDLKLRLSFGQTGNSNIGNNAFEYYTSAWHQYVFGSNVSTGTAKLQLANPDLKWETTTELNIGLDFGFFDQRLSGTFEFFNKEVKDLLGYRSLKSFMEVSSVAANIGKTRSRGVELSLKSRNFVGEFRWDTEFTLTHYNDRWKERNPEDELKPWQKDNDPIRAHYGYLSDGILGIDEKAPASMPALLPGQYKVKDVDGYVRDEFGDLVMDSNGNVQYTGAPDGIIDEADIVLLGTFDPGVSMGLSNTFSYKGFDLNIFFYGMFDRIVNNATRGKYSIPEIRRILNGQNMMLEVKDRWSKDNPDATLPSGFVSVYPQPSDYLWEKAWFIRCKNITLGYTLPSKCLGKALSHLRVFLDFSNPFVITPYTGNDPETDFKAGYPNQRTYMIGLDLTF